MIWKNKHLFAGVTTEKAIGEASPRYLTHPRSLGLIHKFIPDAKLIVSLRQPAENRLDALRQAMGCVPQESVLFSASLRENIALARPDASDAEIEHVIGIAALARDIAGFPAGLQTEVGERGVTLSGGQRQRLWPARALLADCRLLLLDDALSAVDAETEHQILGELERHTAHLSRVIVSHRLSAVQEADEILVLRAGTVTERGTHAALLELGGWYAETWRYQQLAAGSFMKISMYPSLTSESNHIVKNEEASHFELLLSLEVLRSAFRSSL